MLIIYCFWSVVSVTITSFFLLVFWLYIGMPTVLLLIIEVMFNAGRSLCAMPARPALLVVLLLSVGGRLAHQQ